MILRIRRTCCCFALTLLAAVGPAAAQDYEGYPYTIMAPERGATPHHSTTVSKRTRHTEASSAPVSVPQGGPAGAPANAPASAPAAPAETQAPHKKISIAHGSSGLVLPTPLPRTQLIPPEQRGLPPIHPFADQQGATVLPGMNPIPNLAHGPETFQDRASRCAFQQGLNNVAGNLRTQYMGACIR